MSKNSLKSPERGRRVATARVKSDAWPFSAGEYHALCQGGGCCVAVSTLSSAGLAERLAAMRPRGLCIVGKTETENIGIEKVVKNTVTNPGIRYLVLAGQEPVGQRPGATLLALWENGLDRGMRVVGAPGSGIALKNVTREEVRAFRKQVQVVDMIGCEDAEQVARGIDQLAQDSSSSRTRAEYAFVITPVQTLTAPIVEAMVPNRVEMDRAGYFVVIPQPEKQTIAAEHYSYDNKLLRVIEGKDARGIYLTVIEKGWVTQLSHAAYLGRELARAELSLKLGMRYIQDGA